jgi:hypothetical protein
MQIDITYTDLMTMFRGVTELRQEANRKTYENDAMIKKTTNEEKKAHLLRLQDQYYVCKEQIDNIYYKLKDQIDQID